MSVKIAARWLGLSLLITILILTDLPTLAHSGSRAPSLSDGAVTATPPAAETPATVARLRPVYVSLRYDPSSDARMFVALINRTRKVHGLRPLALRKDLTSIALRWSARMARKGEIWHNGRFRYESTGWWLLGENVGWTKGSIRHLHRAFMASPKHRRNILDPRFTSIGVGETPSVDGRIFVAQNFGRFTRL